LGNHDKPRIASRIGLRKSRAAALLLLSLPGTLTIYYGEELGMQDVPIAPDEARDPAEIRQPGIGMGRDPERTPMPWSISPGSPGCGFTENEPWLPIGEANRRVNVESSEEDPDSMLAFYRHLIELRRAEPALVSGQLTGVSAEGDVLRLVRSDGKKHFEALINLGEQMRQVPIGEGKIVTCTELRRRGELVRDTLDLSPAEALLIRSRISTP
jgi:alpha-glucosidase